jgi:polysaccharide pyruvyl transferase WcaK-like protein
LHHCSYDFEHAIGVSIGIGPFVQGSFPQKQADKKIKSCDWISVRDTLSVQYCRNLGIGNVDQYSDLCFARELWDEAPTREPRKGGMNRVGVIIRDWRHTREGQSYFGKVKETVQKLRCKEIEIRFISFAQQADSQTLSDLNSSSEDILQWNPNKQTLRAFIKDLDNFDLLISARAHGVIMGAALGIPSIAIEVEPKLRIICDKLTGGTKIWSPPFEPDKLVETVMSMRSNWQEHCNRIFLEGSACASEALTSTEVLKTYLKQAVS